VILALGTLRAPKIAGVRAALAQLARTGWPAGEATLAPVDVPSGQADTPVGDAAIIAGARSRARSTLAATPAATLALGLEGGVVVIGDRPLQAVLRNWVVAWDGEREGIGSSPSLLLPPELAEPVFAGEDLAAAIDRYAQEHDVRSRQGAFGVLTCDLITRADAYAQAVVAALAPWYNGAREA
jgi:inosine/xanthosine triphosphatase